MPSVSCESAAIEYSASMRTNAEWEILRVTSVMIACSAHITAMLPRTLLDHLNTAFTAGLTKIVLSFRRLSMIENLLS